MNPRQFLMFGGAVLLLLGTVGYIGIFSEQNTPWFWLDPGENLAHTVLGAVALAAVFVPGLNTALAPFYRWIVILVGILALFFAVYGFLQPRRLERGPEHVRRLEPREPGGQHPPPGGRHLGVRGGVRTDGPGRRGAHVAHLTQG